MTDYIVVTNWEEVDINDFYLTDQWLKESELLNDEEIEEIRQMARDKELYIAYEVSAKYYALYRQMDAYQIFINVDGDHMLYCETVNIDNNHCSKWESDL